MPTPTPPSVPTAPSMPDAEALGLSTIIDIPAGAGYGEAAQGEDFTDATDLSSRWVVTSSSATGPTAKSGAGFEYVLTGGGSYVTYSSRGPSFRVVPKSVITLRTVVRLASGQGLVFGLVDAGSTPSSFVADGVFVYSPSSGTDLRIARANGATATGDYNETACGSIAKNDRFHELMLRIHGYASNGECTATLYRNGQVVGRAAPTFDVDHTVDLHLCVSVFEAGTVSLKTLLAAYSGARTEQ